MPAITAQKEQMSIVIVGHVDHGKSTVIGRLLADTGSLPQGKLEQVKANCARNSKPFEYAFLLDALKDEQSQGITIDTARCFFKTAKRDYIIIDAPGHIEFLKNMVTGASRAEAALLVIDAQEGIQENSRRHGYLVSMLGLKQVTILVNKMDLVKYDRGIFEGITREYTEFLERINVKPVSFIPISAREGENITGKSARLPWHSGCSVLEQLDEFAKAPPEEHLPFRLPVQDIYKFTDRGDERRIVAGTVLTGRVRAGDRVVFLPSGKTSEIKTVEVFNAAPKKRAAAGEAAGVTLSEQVYVKPGEIMARMDEKPPQVGSHFLANVFWVGRAPMIKNRNYRLKLAATRISVRLVEIRNVLDASDLTSDRNKQQIDRHDVAECAFETARPIAFDLASELEKTSRFVIVDNFEIAGGGIVLGVHNPGETILQRHIRDRELIWERGSVTADQRTAAYAHRGKFILFTGDKGIGKKILAKALESRLFHGGLKAYYLGISNLALGLESDVPDQAGNPAEHVNTIGELARIMTDAGQIFITSISGADEHDLHTLKLLNEPYEIFVVNVGENNCEGYPVDINISRLHDREEAVEGIFRKLIQKDIISDYSI